MENRELIVQKLIDRFMAESFIGNVERILSPEDTQTKGIIRLTTTDGYLFDVMIDGKNISSIIQGKEDGEPYPTIKIEQIPMQGIPNEKIQVKVTAQVETIKETTGILTIERLDNREIKEYTEGGVIFDIEKNGTYLFSATTNKGKSKTGKIEINIIPPKDKIVITAEPTEVTNQKVEVTINYGETEFTNQNKYQYRVGKEGSWETAGNNQTKIEVQKNTIIVARYYDGTNSFYVESYNIQNIDKEAPKEFEYTVAVTTNSITITATTEDIGSEGCNSENIGITKIEYSKDNGVTWQISDSFTNLTTGDYTVKVRAIDKAENVRYGTSSKSKIEEETVALNTVSGTTIIISSTPTTPTNGNVTINISYANNGLTRQYKRSTDSVWTTVSATTASFATSDNISIAVRYTDGVNYFNGTTYNVQNIDKVAPSVPSVNLNGYSNGSWTRGNVTITLSATDTGSAGTANGNIGIQTYQYSKDGGGWTNCSSTVSITSDQNSTYKFRSVDKAGNISGETTIYTIRRDGTAPTISSVNSTNITSNSFTIQMAGADNLSGVAKIEYSGDNGSSYINNGTNTSYNFTGLAGSTTYYVRVRVTDNAGNQSTSGTVNVVTLSAYPLVKDKLQSGNYVKYTPTSQNYTITSAYTGTNDQTNNTASYTGTWRVLYDYSTDGKCEIVSSDNVIDDLYLMNQSGYDNYITTLNLVSSYYVNINSATRGRVVGSDPNNITSEDSYTIDFNKMKTLNINNIGKMYWLSARTTNSTVRMISSTGTLSSYLMNNQTTRKFIGVRPVIQLKPDAKVVGGDGSAGNPYIVQ